GRPYWEWKRVRRLLSGRRTMFQDAQRANGRKNAADESEILASYGLEVRESDGALVTTGDPVDPDYRTPNFLFSGTLDPKLPDYGRDDHDDHGSSSDHGGHGSSRDGDDNGDRGDDNGRTG
ncbi:MAG: ABC transporter permease, partial [Corynebacterium nuruki]|nr:ABC transporter permease [Corynebacterium nuruki]